MNECMMHEGVEGARGILVCHMHACTSTIEQWERMAGVGVRVRATTRVRAVMA